MKVFALIKHTGADKLPKQAAAIVNVFKNRGGGGVHRTMSHEEVLKALELELETSQPVARVFSFYRSTLVKNGFLEEINTPTPTSTSSAMKFIKALQLPLEDGDYLNLKVLRGFKTPDHTFFLLCGECADCTDDHALWHVNDTAELVGVFTPKVFDMSLKAKTLELHHRDFAYLERSWHGRMPLQAHHTPKTALASLNPKQARYS